MSSHNPQGRRRRPSNTSSKSDRENKSGPNRRTGSSSPPWKSDSKESGKKSARPAGSKSKFGSSNAGGPQKSSDKRRSNSSGRTFESSNRQDLKSRTSRDPRQEKSPFKSRDGEFPSGSHRKGGKFGSSNAPRSGDEQKSPYKRRSNSSDEPFKTSSRQGPRSRPAGGPRKEKAPFKSKGGELPSGLRRERPYEKSDESGQSIPVRKTFSKNAGRSKKSATDVDKIQPDLKAPAQTEKIRLNRFIANSGVCSRREADELIKMGIISVNGKVITEMGYKVNPGDEVRHESKVLRAERPVYILLNKPKGFLTTTSDPQERNTVMHLIGNKVKERVYPVGRLDRNTTGLLLLTNDGDLADKLMHPSYNVKKIYKVELDKPLTKADAQLILDGVQLEEGKAMVDDLAIISDDKRSVGLEIHIGWNRVVRRIFETLNYEVIKLDRSVYAGLDKKNLGRGEWRFLTREELVRVKHF